MRQIHRDARLLALRLTSHSDSDSPYTQSHLTLILRLTSHSDSPHTQAQTHLTLRLTLHLDSPHTHTQTHPTLANLAVTFAFPDHDQIVTLSLQVQ